MFICLHYNPTQPHQIEHGQWFADGFNRHGIKFLATPDRDQSADIHIVSGPHYAKSRWEGDKTILLDSAYYHDEKSGKWVSTDWVSLGWLGADGEPIFEQGEGREPPEIQENHGTGTIFLADYGGPYEAADTLRYHPAEKTPPEPLPQALARHKTAIGYKTAALVRAALMGLDVISRKPNHIINNPDWLIKLPYIDWRYDEIQSGEAWEHLWRQL